MLSVNPDERPTASKVQEYLLKYLTNDSGLGAAEGVPSRIHCDPLVKNINEWNFGFDDLRLQSQRAAADACEAVAPSATEARSIPLGNGGVCVAITKKDQVNKPALEHDRVSLATKTSRSSDGKSKGSGSRGAGVKPKPKAQAWKAPVYAEFSFG